MKINQDIAAFNVYRNLSANQLDLSKSLAKLASGNRINQAASDAAGLAINQNLLAQVSGIGAATRNVQEGVSVVQSAESGLDDIQGKLQRMRELAVQSANGAQSPAARSAAQAEYTQLNADIQHIASSTMFGHANLLDGSVFGKGVDFQVGPNRGDTLSVTISAVGAQAEIVAVGADSVGTQAAAQSAIADIDKALSYVSGAQGQLGAVQNRFESTVNSLQVASESTQSAQGRIGGTDIALEVMNYARSQILANAGGALAAQTFGLHPNTSRLLG